MNDDEFVSPGASPSAGASVPQAQAVLDSDWGPAPTATLPPRLSTTVSSPTEAVGEFTGAEVVGDPPSTGSESTAAGETDREMTSAAESTESAGETAEASAEQLETSAGQESAVSDLRTVEGFEESTGAVEAGAETGLAEVGETLGGESAEFLPFLAALVPTLISSVGPAIAKGIAGRLSPRAKKAIGKMPVPAPGSVKPGSTGALLAQIAQLLKSLQNRPSGESSMEAAAESTIAEAVAVLEVVIGADDRVRLRNTKDLPWRRICALRITFPNGKAYRGSGSLIGPRSVLTAGHCVYSHGDGGWARTIEVSPGADGSLKPFGSAQSSQFRTMSGWVSAKRPESDYACIVLPANAFGGYALGSFGFSAMSAADLVAQPAVLAGYPGDKPIAEMWGAARRIKSVLSATLVYDIDTAGGQSGAPVYVKRNGARYIVGIHNYGAGTGNSATRVTPAVAKHLLAWSKL